MTVVVFLYSDHSKLVSFVKGFVLLVQLIAHSTTPEEGISNPPGVGARPRPNLTVDLHWGRALLRCWISDNNHGDVRLYDGVINAIQRKYP